MKKIRYLVIEFSNPLHPREVPAFRGAVAGKVGAEHVNFHHHLSEREFLFGYPVIQYKSIRRQAALVCVDFGVDEVHHFFQNKSWELSIGERKETLEVRNLRMRQFVMQVWDKSFEYRIVNWLPFNDENYSKFKSTDDWLSHQKLLEGILTGNILSFAKGIKWDVDREINVRVDEIVKRKTMRIKDQTFLGLDVSFRSNVFLPNYIGLGKSPSKGYGMVRQWKKRNSNGKKKTA
jgi:hypothetical protein